MKTIGFDFGSVYTKAILINGDKITDCLLYTKNESDPLHQICDFLDEVAKSFPGKRFKVGVTGLSVSNFQNELAITNAIIATATGANKIGFKGRSIIEIGGQNGKLICLDHDKPASIKEFSMNDACASGCGMFIEQQAKRLQLSLANFSDLSSKAGRQVAIAGRCAVFAKSDMIHLQQKGAGVDELGYGLCKAICRNFQAMLLKGRELETPIMLAGGCARNKGIIRGFKETLGLKDPDKMIISSYPGLEGAIGAAVIAEKEAAKKLLPEEIREKLVDLLEKLNKDSERLPELQDNRKHLVQPEPEDVFAAPKRGFLGVDVGSVSTDLVVLDENAKVVSSVYLPTRGRPIEAISEGLKIINNRFQKGLKVLGCGTTGSGRHLAGKIIGADIIKNEITCQFLGVQHYIGDIETIFEIGGQDSKFISVNNGSVEDFVMNKVCAAGTGSFLEEQATELGISIVDEFSQLAFSSTSPIDLGSHCTVFMETEVVKALQQGVSTADICAGLAYSIARNYLERVAANKPIGKNLAFQGGVASNRAVVAAFEEILQQPIKVMPYNRISGAIGAALAAKDHMNGQGSLFKGFFCSDNVKLTTFQCKNCSNNCEVSIIEQGNDKLYFGDICERYTSKGKSTKTQRNIPNLAKEYISNCETYFDQHGTQNLKIGIPRASTIMGFLPFWGTFFRELDCNAVLSDKTSTEILSLGLKSLPASVCLPAKLTAGHVSSLIEKKVDVVFMPSIMHLPGNDNEHSYACPYAMAMPFMINCRGSAKVLSPVLSMTDEDAFVEGFAGYLAQFNTTTAKVREAYARGMAEQKNFHERFRKRAAQLIADDDYSYIFSVIGKPYNIFDPYINLDLFERLRKLDILAIPLEILPLKTEEIDCILPWQLSAEVFKGTIATVNSRNIYPLLISNYGCAPDAFTFRQLDSFLQNQPHLIVEFDEHRGEVGLVTRLEAFIDQLESVKSKRIQVRGKGQMPKSAALVPDKEIPICMPYWSDYVHAYAGIWEKQGYQVEILPLPNQNIRLLGEKHTLGKECSPYAMIVGDLIHLHQKNPKRNLVYHFPSVTFPCLLNQYGNSIQILIQKLGIANILLSSLNGVELTNAFGIVPMQRLYEGLLAIDVLVKASCETRPYELEKGMTDAVHQQNLQRIRRGLAENDVFAPLESSLEAITRIPVDKSMPRPQVGIAGDLYTKVNETANNNLFMWLEEQGLEVWPSPSQVDLLDCGITSGFLQSLEKLNFSQMLGTGAVALKSMIAAWRVRNTVGNRIKHLKEPGYLEMIKLARPYMNNNNYELLLVNIAKIVDFVERGADGVINAICFNCMVGNASAAIIEKIRKDYHDTPIITAVYSGNENPGRQMQIDAFVCQIKENFNGKRQKRSGKKQLQAEI